MVKPVPQTDYSDKICGSVTKTKYSATQRQLKEKVSKLPERK